MNVLKGLGRVIIIFVSVSLSFIIHANALEEFSSSLNPVGSGARAAGMGGAFISVADDATAASWNPAGLVQLEKPEISAVYSYFHREQRYTSPYHTEMETVNTVDAEALNYASLAYPFILLNRNMIISLNYQRLYEMNKDIDFMYTWDDPAYQSDENVEFVQEGALYTLSPAFAVQVIPELYFGATLNFWDNYVGRNGWTKTQNSHETGTMMGFLPFERRVERKEDASFKGTNAHFGLLWAINSSLTLGGVYKTPFNADVEKKKSFFQSTCYTTLPPPNCSALPADETTENVIMRMPASYGLGLAYRHSDAWTLAIDVYRTEWSNFVIRQEDESEVNPLTSESIDNGRLKDTTQIRLGTEYLFIKEAYAVPVRFGLFYDPEPATGHIDEFYGFSLGAGYARGRIVLDAAYQFRKGNNTSGDIPSVEGLGSDVDQHLLMVSGILYFGGK